MLDGPACFNPLDRGNLYLIIEYDDYWVEAEVLEFQSPRSGKFVSDVPKRCLQQSKRYNVSIP